MDQQQQAGQAQQQQAQAVDAYMEKFSDLFEEELIAVDSTAYTKQLEQKGGLERVEPLH